MSEEEVSSIGGRLLGRSPRYVAADRQYVLGGRRDSAGGVIEAGDHLVNRPRQQPGYHKKEKQNYYEASDHPDHGIFVAHRMERAEHAFTVLFDEQTAQHGTAGAMAVVAAIFVQKRPQEADIMVPARLFVQARARGFFRKSGAGSERFGQFRRTYASGQVAVFFFRLGAVRDELIETKNVNLHIAVFRKLAPFAAESFHCRQWPLGRGCCCRPRRREHSWRSGIAPAFPFAGRIR